MCDDQNPQEDTQNHLITCKKLSNEVNISQIYGTVDEQLCKSHENKRKNTERD